MQVILVYGGDNSNIYCQVFRLNMATAVPIFVVVIFFWTAQLLMEMASTQNHFIFSWKGQKEKNIFLVKNEILIGYKNVRANPPRG